MANNNYLSIHDTAIALTKFFKLFISPAQTLEFAFDYNLQLSLLIPQKSLAKWVNVNHQERLKKQRVMIPLHLYSNYEEIKGVFRIPISPINTREIHRQIELERLGSITLHNGERLISVDGNNGREYLLYRPADTNSSDEEKDPVKNILPLNSEIVIKNDDLQDFFVTAKETNLTSKLSQLLQEQEKEAVNKVVELLQQFRKSGEITENASIQIAMAVGGMTYKEVEYKDYIEQIETHTRNAQTFNARSKKSEQAQEQKKMIQERYLILINDKPNLSKDAAADLISKEPGITLGRGRVRKALINI